MNYNRENGWYYNNGYDKSPSWSGVEFLKKFLISNKGIGPYGNEVQIENIGVGDIIQISFDGNVFAHTVIVVDRIGNELGNILISSHTEDSFARSILSYDFGKLRGIRIEGCRF